MKKRIVEICCGSYADAIASFEGGAERIELNSALYLGGLTPSIASLRLVKKHTSLEVITMIRPRGGGFCYDENDLEVMMLEAECLMAEGADGIAFGVLNKDSSINIEATRELTYIAHKYNGDAIFHRAFDCVKDPYKEIETLIDIGIDRILTSGQQPKAIDGISLIKELQEKYGDKIEILAGSGINETNAIEIMDKTGIYQVHSSCKDWIEDSTTINENNPSLNYSYAPYPHEKDYEIVSEEKVRKLTSLL